MSRNCNTPEYRPRSQELYISYLFVKAQSAQWSITSTSVHLFYYRFIHVASDPHRRHNHELEDDFIDRWMQTRIYMGCECKSTPRPCRVPYLPHTPPSLVILIILCKALCHSSPKSKGHENCWLNKQRLENAQSSATNWSPHLKTTHGEI